MADKPIGGKVLASVRISGIIRAKSKRIGGDVRVEPKISGVVRAS